jgi:hypothetical protein
MTDENREDMPDLSVRDLKTDMIRRFSELKTELKAEMREEHIETRRHFDVIAESLRAELRLRLEGTDTRIDDHERRIQALEKRRR